MDLRNSFDALDPRNPGFIGLFFFCCIAERAIKPCRSSRSKLRGEFGIPRHSQNRKPKTHQSNKTKQEHKTNKRQKPASAGM